MNLSIFCKSVAALVAATSLVSGSLEAHKSRHQSLSSASCCKSVKKHVHTARKAIDRIEQQALGLNKTAPTPITQKEMHDAGGVLLLTDSGDYCLTENICGTILVKANSVCLDLCCHTLNAEGKPHAIIATGFEGLKVFDGRIINSSVSAISIDNYNSIELFKLVMSDHALDAIRIASSFDISVHDVDFINDNAGERAMWFDTCQSITVNNCNASGFLSTIGAIIQLDSCDVVSVQDVNVTGNTKTSSATTNEFSPGTAFVSVISSTGVDFTRVLVNNNTFDNNVPVADQNNHWRTAEAILFMESTSCSLHQCETSNNTDIAGALATPDTEEYILLFLLCDSCVATEHKSNNNSCEEIILYYSAMVAFDSTNIVMDGCQVNNTSVQLLSSLTLPRYMPIWISPYFGFPQTKDCVIRNCQANFNVLQTAPASPTVDMSLFAIRFEASGVIDSCQANQNSFAGGNIPKTAVAGISVAGPALDVTVSNSHADNNLGAEISAGIVIFNAASNVTVCDSSASSNGNYGLAIFNFDSIVSHGNIEITNSVFNGNGGANPAASNPTFGPVTAAGIIITNAGSAFHVNGYHNILIKDCQIYDTASTNAISGFPVGIYATLNTNVVIEDTNVFNTTTTSLHGGQGILFDTVTDSKILRTQVHGNQGSGIELIGENTNVAILNSIALNNSKGFSVAAGSSLVHGLIQGNKAVGNTSVGFEHTAVLPSPFDTAYFNNYAQNNGVNYSISNYIQVVTYSIPTAIYTLVPNGATDFPTLANIDAT